MEILLDYFIRGYYKIGKNGCFVQYNFNEADDADMNIGLSDLSTVLTTSKSPIYHFFISTSNPESFETVPKFIETLSKEVCPLVYAETVELYAPNNDCIIPFLSLFKPGVLEKIELVYAKLDDDTLAKLVEMDQFKQLKSIKICDFDPIDINFPAFLISALHQLLPTNIFCHMKQLPLLVVRQ